MKLKSKLQDPARLLTTEYCILPSASVAQALASTGVDCLIIDREHAATNNETLHAMIAATQGFDCAPLVRVVDHSPAHVKVALDLGAEGIMFPLVKSVEEAKACVASTRYPPDGTRGWGPFVAHSRWSVGPFDYLPQYGDKIVCCLLIETVEALAVVDEIFAVDGVDMAFVAPFDLSTSLGLSGQFDHPDFLAAVDRIETAARKAQMPLGGGALADSQDKVRALHARGYRIFADFDVLQLKRAAARLVDDVAAVAADVHR